MCTAGIRELAWGCLAGMLLAASAGHAAELVGVVHLRQTGLFQDSAAAPVPTGGISVSLQPLEGQPLPPRGSTQRHRLLLKDGQMRPAFITLQVGDSLQILNQDEVHHEIFALSATQPIEAALDKHSTGAAAQAEFRLASEGVWHLFCRIHSRSFARVDAVTTPLLRMVEPGAIFRFEGLAAGQWQLRVAALGAETRLLKTVAVTEPPPLRIELDTRGGGVAGQRQAAPVEGRIDALFPRD